MIYDIVFIGMYEAEVVVKFIAPDGNPAIVMFEARVKGGSSDQSCSVGVSNQIKSFFIGLRSSKDYYKRPGGSVGIWEGS